MKRYPWSQEYTGDEYLQLLNTYSPHLNLEAERRSRLYAAIGELIDRDFGGTVAQPYLSVLYLARKQDLARRKEDRG